MSPQSYACLSSVVSLSYSDKSGPWRMKATVRVHLLDQITPSAKQEQLLTTENWLQMFWHCTGLTPVKMYRKTNQDLTRMTFLTTALLCNWKSVKNLWRSEEMKRFEDPKRF